jgi:lysophospholipase L1-like esterase
MTPAIRALLLSSLPAYWGPVATRGRIPDLIHATNTQIMSQTRHFARDSFSSIKLVVANWAAVGLSGPTRVEEANCGAEMSVTASVSTDLSTWTRVKWSGLDTGTVAIGGTQESDETAFSVGQGGVFYVRLWKSCATGISYCGTGTGDSGNSDLFRIGTSVVDSTDGSAFTSSAANFSAPPVAILARTRKPTVLLIGDSISWGYGDTYTNNASGDIGKLSRSIGASLGYINCARSSDDAQRYLLSGTKRTALQQYVSHVIGGHGRNDLDNARTAAQIKADILSIAALFSKPVYWDTISPMSTSTDAWATVVNQTTSASNTARATVNDWLRTTPGGLTGVFDSCIALENSPATNDGKWIASYTGDGQHPSPTGYAAILSSGVINPAVLRRRR